MKFFEVDLSSIKAAREEVKEEISVLEGGCALTDDDLVVYEVEILFLGARKGCLFGHRGLLYEEKEEEGVHVRSLLEWLCANVVQMSL